MKKISIQKKTKYINRILMTALFLSGYIILFQFFKLQELKYAEKSLNGRIEKLEAIMKNVQETLIGQGEGIYQKTDYKNVIKQAIKKTDNYYYLKNMTVFQKQYNYEQHGKQYKLRYDWMINPVNNGYMALKSCEFGTPRMEADGKVYAHTGVDQTCVNDTEIITACDGAVIEIGFNILGGNYVIMKTEKIETNLKTGKDETIVYENYYGHLSKIDVIKDQIIMKGDRVGIMGETGKNCFGVHLHWSIKRNGVLMNPFINTTWNNLIIEKILTSYYNF